MAWILLTCAGILEVVWAYAMKQSEGFTKAVPTMITLLTMAASFALLSIAMKSIPLGTAYPVWTGIGAIGAFLVRVLVLDEPASGLDPKARALLKVALGALRSKGTTVFLTSHALADVDEICDSMAVLHGGALRYVGTPEGLRIVTGQHSLESAFLATIE